MEQAKNRHVESNTCIKSSSELKEAVLPVYPMLGLSL